MLGVIQKLPRTNLSDELKSQINSFIASEDERIPLPEQLLTDLSDLYHARYYQKAFTSLKKFKAKI
jgi:hypothetical protein